MRNYLINGHAICVRAAPSIAEQQRMAAQENDRIERQRIALGPDGLKAKAEELTAATVENGRLPPAEMLTQVPIPSPDSIRFHALAKWRMRRDDEDEVLDGVVVDDECEIVREGGSEEVFSNFDMKALPCHVEAFDVHTNFVYVSIWGWEGFL